MENSKNDCHERILINHYNKNKMIVSEYTDKRFEYHFT